MATPPFKQTLNAAEIRAMQKKRGGAAGAIPQPMNAAEARQQKAAEAAYAKAEEERALMEAAKAAENPAPAEAEEEGPPPPPASMKPSRKSIMSIWEHIEHLYEEIAELKAEIHGAETGDK